MLPDGEGKTGWGDAQGMVIDTYEQGLQSNLNKTIRSCTQGAGAWKRVQHVEHHEELSS